MLDKVCEWYVIGIYFNLVFVEMFCWFVIFVGVLLLVGELFKYGGIVYLFVGGIYYVFVDWVGGFCYFNDFVLLIFLLC